LAPKVPRPARISTAIIKEDLADIIYRIDQTRRRWSAPAPASAPRRCSQWLIQELNAAADNAQPEGFTVMQAVIKPVRLNNVCRS
jgi:hypothetical protein